MPVVIDGHSFLF